MRAFDRVVGCVLLSLLILTSCDSGSLKRIELSVEPLREYIEASDAFQQTGWGLREVYAAEGRLFVLLDFPPKSTNGQARRAPVYTELVGVCPIVGLDDYWEARYAAPFTLYLARTGRQNAEAIAFCTRDLDHAAYKRQTNPQSVAEEPLVQLPPVDTDAEGVNRRLEEGDPSFVDAESELHNDNMRALQHMLFERPELVDMYSSQGRTLLFDADSPAEVMILIAFGANPNVADVDGISALEWLSKFDHKLSALKQLIEMGAAARHVHPEYAGSAEIASILLDNGAAYSDDSLYLAISNGMPGVADVLHERGARLNTTTSVDSPIHEHVRRLSLETEAGLPQGFRRIETFVQLGAAINHKDSNGLTPLAVVMQSEDWHGKQALIDLLRRLGAEE